jgi:hypothetical protein
MDFLGYIFIRQTTYTFQKMNDHLKLSCSTIFLFKTEKYRLSGATTLSTWNQWMDFYENRYEPYTNGRQPNTVYFYPLKAVT